jgi:putative IMPACT (imprinted ancient) family translation regulator
METIKPIKTIEGFSEANLKEKGSLFVARAYYSTSTDKCMSILAEVRKKYFDATHHCYCYKLNNGETKYSDNGEPSGTAGIRILNAIEHFGLTDLILIITRYFGGTKLGVGPLGKAYYQSAFDSLSSSCIIVKNPYREVRIETNFEKMGHVFRILTTVEGRQITSDYKEVSVEIKGFVLCDKINLLIKLTGEFSQGDINIDSSLEIVYL